MALNTRMTVTEAGRELVRWLLDYLATLATALLAAGVALALFLMLRTHEDGLIERLLESEGRALSSEMTRALEARTHVILEFARRWEGVADPDQAAWERDAQALTSADPVYRAFEWRDASFQPLWSTPLTARLPGAELDSTFESDRVSGAAAMLQPSAGAVSASFPGPGGRRMIIFAAPLMRDGSRIGAIGVVARAGDLIGAIVKPATQRGYSVAVREGPYHVFGPLASRESAAAERWKRTVVVRVGEVVWAVDYWPGGELLDRLRSLVVPLVLLVGLFTAVIGAGMVRAQELARRAARASGPKPMTVRDAGARGASGSPHSTHAAAAQPPAPGSAVDDGTVRHSGTSAKTPPSAD